MLNEIMHFLDSVKSLKVLVVGETIIDEFVEVDYEGQSMKSICPVFRIAGKTVRQSGGALAIANHLKDFVAQVDIITNGQEEIVKTRYIDINSQKKHVEINKFHLPASPELRIEKDSYDVIIIADFGHGFCDKLVLQDGFHLMCQTNSNNFGFNRISKWKKYKKQSVCIDLREASLQINKKIHNPCESDIEEIYNYELDTSDLFVTAGRSGSFYCNGSSMIFRESFECEVVDTIGAGDTFFSFASLSSHINSRVKLDNLLLVPSLAASLSTTWLCNEESVTKDKLLKHANRFL